MGVESESEEFTEFEAGESGCNGGCGEEAIRDCGCE